MECDDNVLFDKDAFGVQRANPFSAARRERNVDAGHSPSAFVVLATSLCVPALHVHVALKVVLGVEVDVDAGRSTFNFRFTCKILSERLIKWE